MHGFYDLIFAYKNGDVSKPNIEAGTMLRGMMKVAMCHHGNSSQYRLRANQSGFANLTLAGVWLTTGLDARCVKAATMGGMQAARAICGWPVVIRGESGLYYLFRSKQCY